MKTYIHDDFLLENEPARVLYHTYAETCPILDYHTHLNPAQIAANSRFENIAQAWLGGDHYKWRAMRTCGVSEQFITGAAPEKEKFMAWARTMPKLLRNPQYDWTHLELLRYFGIDQVLDESTADAIWEQTAAFFAADGHGARDLIVSQNVRVVCTTDDPADTLEHHQRNNQSCTALKLCPSWRPGRAMACTTHAELIAYVQTFAHDAATYDDALQALKKRHDFFAENQCRVSDYSIESPDMLDPESPSLAAALLRVFSAWDAEKNFVRQLHIGALRNPNERMFARLGADTGFDAVNDFNYMVPLAKHLSKLDCAGALPRTIIYNLNARDNSPLAVLCAAFNDGTPGGKVNLGAAWWYLDQLDGMRENLATISRLGAIGQFVGMLTDSRSVLSAPRHEYFRRLFCNMIGEDITRGRMPSDIALSGELVRRVCYANAKDYFHF